MKVLLIHNCHYLKGGAEKVYLETGRILSEKGHSVIFFSTKNPKNFKTPYERYFVPSVDIEKSSLTRKLKFFTSFFYSLKAKKNLEMLIQHEKPDIAHLHIFYGRLTSSILPVLKKHNIPTVMTVHEYKMLCPMSIFLDWKGNICEKCAEGKYYNCIINKCNRGNWLYSSISAMECYFRDIFFPWEKHIDMFIIVSKFLLKKYIEYKPSLREKAVVIYNSIDLNSFIPYHSHKGYYLYFGRLSREKGIMTLLKAWKKFPNLRLKIVGSGNLETRLKKFLKDNKMSNVELIGFKFGEELRNIIRDAKFTIVPSEWYETFGLTILESFASGTPVIASNIGAIPEFVKNNFNGFLFETGNIEDLIYILKKAESVTEGEYIVLSKNARRFAERKFSENRYYNQLIKIYEEVKGN